MRSDYSTVEDLYLKISVLLPKEKIVYSLDEWDKGAVPWTMMFSMLGRLVAREMEFIPSEQKDELFGLIGTAMKEGGEFPTTVIATGFLEGMYSEASGDEKVIGELAARLDDASLDYLRDWLAWSDIVAFPKHGSANS